MYAFPLIENKLTIYLYKFAEEVNPLVYNQFPFIFASPCSNEHKGFKIFQCSYGVYAIKYNLCGWYLDLEHLRKSSIS